MSKVRGHTAKIGYCWKFCPFSNSYKNKYYDNSFAGNTTNPDITQANFTMVVTALHPFTEGTMVYHNRGGGPGWLCLDNDCPYFIDNGERYFEK